jgi:hypothetical protein
MKDKVDYPELYLELSKAYAALQTKERYLYEDIEKLNSRIGKKDQEITEWKKKYSEALDRIIALQEKMIQGGKNETNEV